MKRFVAVLAGLLTLPAFGEIAPLYFEEMAAQEKEGESTAEDTVVSEPKTTVVPAASQSGRANTRGRVANRNATARNANVSRASRAGVVSRTAAPVATATRATAARSAANVTGRPSRNEASTNQIATTRRTMQGGKAKTARAALTTTDTVNTPLYSGNVVSRAAMRSSGASAVRARIPTISASVSNTAASTVSTTATATTESAASVATAMDNLAQLTDFCKAQYTECMDNFCNVLDDNQGRCSCSKNIKNYEKTETALKSATEALQDVAQQIQYIGLTSDEIQTLFTQTEAEAAMSGNSDNSQLKNDLDKIKGLLVGVKSGTASSTEIDSGLSMDLSGLMNFNIDSTGFNLGTLFGNTTTANTNSISNQRGEQLYKTAAARCKSAVLTDCQAQGVDIAVVSNSYDMEIDKQCVAYERALTDANDEMNQTVRNAKGVLQRARLMVAQQKNSYDLRGCINALDSCMQDDFVCGNEYENCLDPFGKYIVEGEVVLGSTPGQTKLDNFSDLTAPQYSTSGLYSTWNYDKNKNAWDTATDNSLAAYVDAMLAEKPDDVGGYSASTSMAQYLQYKIGYYDKSTNKNHGMCMSVLNKCQDYTYEKGEYKPNNPVIKEYLNRTLIQIKSRQDQILASYAETCISDVSSCLGENNYDENNGDSSRSKIALNACRSQIITCMSVNGNAAATPTPAGMSDWVQGIMAANAAGGSQASAKCLAGTQSGVDGRCYVAANVDATLCGNISGVWETGSASGSGLCYVGAGHAYGKNGLTGIYIPDIESSGACSSSKGAVWSDNYSGCYCPGAKDYINGSCQ